MENDLMEKQVQMPSRQEVELALSRSDLNAAMLWQACTIRMSLHTISVECPWVFQLLPQGQWKAHEKEIAQLLTDRPRLIEEFPEFVKDSDEMMGLVVQKDGTCLEFASSRLREDEALAIRALSQSPQAFEFVLPRTLESKKLILHSLKSKVNALKVIVRMSAKWKDDAEIFYMCALRSATVFPYLGSDLKSKVREQVNAIPYLKPAGALYYLWKEQQAQEEKKMLEQMLPAGHLVKARRL